MRIGVDIDDVIYPWYARAEQACRDAGIIGDVAAATWHPWEEYGITKEAWWEVLNAATFSGFLYHGGEPVDGSKTALEKLREAGHTIHLVTARGAHPESPTSFIREATAWWLTEHEIRHDSLTFSVDKTIMWVDTFVEDNPKAHDALWAAGTPCWLIDQPWNHYRESAPYRVSSLLECSQKILEAFPRAR